MKVCGQILVLATCGKTVIKNFKVNIGRNLKFNHYILKQCKKAGRKLGGLTRVCKLMSLRRRRVLMKSFIEFKFAYCPLVRMCRDKTSDNCINHTNVHFGRFTMTISQHLKNF